MSLPKIRKQIESRIQDAGDTMAGFLTLSGNPTSNLHAATKQYVDNKVPSVAETANKLSSAKTISLTGDVSGSGNFDGSNNLSITATVADNSHNHSNYLLTSGGTMTGNIYFPNNRGIIQNQNSTSNYTNIITWLQGGVSENSYDPQIGHHNTGDTNGAIILLPYSTANSPWSGNDGLYIGSTNLYYNGSSVLNTSNFTSWVPKKDGTGATGTWGISISGKATKDGNGNVITSTYLPLSGGELTGVVSRKYPASSDDQVRTWNDVFSWSARNASGKGTLKITFPVSWTNSMVMMEVDVFIYASDTYGGHSAKYLIGFYNYQPTPGWYHVFCYAVGGYGLPGITMRLAHDGSKCCLLLGSTTYTWNYPMVNISKVTEHYGKETSWGGAYTASLLTSESSLTNIQTLYVNGLTYGYNVRANNRYYQGAYAGNLGCIQSSTPGSGQMLWAW